jgi:ribosomal protein S17E
MKMGKAVPKGIKNRANAAMEIMPTETYGQDFNKNKLAVNDLGLPVSKTDRNLISGFITRTVREKAKKAAKEKALSEAQARTEAPATQ